MYLCMEKREIWEAVFGRLYESNEDFEQDFGRATMGKIAVRCGVVAGAVRAARKPKEAREEHLEAD
jgi:hypothetical protein